MPRRFRRTFLVCTALALCIGSAPAGAQQFEDPRTVITLPAPIAEAFRAEMRGHMRSLDDVLYELADGNYDAAANIADVHWDFGHRVWQALEEQGLSLEEIAQRKAEMRAAMEAAGMPMGPGQGASPGMGAGMGQGMGFGRFMPDAFRSMGQGFHAAGQRFAKQARAMGDSPDAAAVTALLSNLQEVTGYCRACHDTFRIVAEAD